MVVINHRRNVDPSLRELEVPLQRLVGILLRSWPCLIGAQALVSFSLGNQLRQLEVWLQVNPSMLSLPKFLTRCDCLSTIHFHCPVHHHF